jgi:TP901 family phage tail tape measure protein
LELDLDVVIGANLKEFKNAIKSAGDDIGGIQSALKTSFNALNKLAKQYPGYFEDALKFAKDLSKEFDKIQNQKTPVRTGQLAFADVASNKYASMVSGAPGKVAKEEEVARRAAAKAIAEEQKAVQALAREKAKEAAAEVKAEKERFNGIVRARYALYDVANEGRRVGLIMVGLGLAAAKAGGDFEKAFKNVERTTGLTGTALENMKQSLLEISQTTPISFKDVTTVATLGAQMGIAAGGVDEFASTVSKFSSVTGVAVDTAATSFGRIAQLLHVSSSEYENLASAVLYAGRNSIATEAQILTLTSQIAASAKQAGFAADETIGLATALASLGIPPEQARGVILRLFADFDKAVAEGGKTLNDYGALMGKTADEIKGLWQNNPAQFFTGFTDALGKSSTTAEGMNGVLASLGITETREVNVLQRLAGNQNLVQKSMENAGASYASNTDLANQYGMATDNLNDKLAKLGNNLLALSAAIGNGIGSVLKPIIDMLSNFVKMLTNNPIAVTIGAISAVVATGTGIFLLYRAAIAQSMATMFALKTSIDALNAKGIEANITLSGLRKVMIELGISGNLATAGLNRASFSMAGLKAAGSGAVGIFTRFLPIMAAIGAGMVVTSIETERANKRLSEMAQELYNVGRAGASLDGIKFFQKGGGEVIDPNKLRGLSDFQTQLDATRQVSNKALDALAGFFMLGDISTLNMAKKDISGVDLALSTLVSNGKVDEAKNLFKQLAAQAKGVGVTQKELSDVYLPNYTAAVQGAIPVTNDLADSQLEASASGENLADIIKTRLTDSMVGGAAEQSKFLDSVMEFSDGLAKSKGSISAWSANGRKALASFGTLLDNIAAMSGNDMATAIQMTAAAIRQIEIAGGDSSAQVQGLVQRINSLYGLNLNGSTVTSIAQLQALIASTGTITAATRAQINSLLTGGQYAAVMQQAFEIAKKSISSTGAAVKKQIRTIKTYASEMSGLFSDIFDRAFSLTESSDAFANGWINIKDRVEAAKQSVKDLQTELDDMGAQKGILTYQLGIAEKYGDTLRATKIRAQLAKLESDLTKKTIEKTKAQDESTLSLTADTQAARDNRDEIRAQVKDAGDLIAAYASTVQANGKLPTKQQVANYAKEVAKGFTDQATAIGFSASELDKYSKIIIGFGSAASKVDNPNVKVSLSPITTAITSYLAEKKETKVSASVGNGDELLTAMQGIFDSKVFKVSATAEIKDYKYTGPSVNPPPAAAPQQSTSDFGMKPLADAGVQQALARYKASLAAAKALLLKATRAGSYSGVISANNSIKTAEDGIKRLQDRYRFASGGFVSGPGTGNSDSINARLSNGEYVIQAQAVNRYGVDFMNSLNQMRVGMPAAVAARGATQSSSVVYLSPEDRALLRAAVDRPIALYTENTKIAQSANAGNIVLAQRGTN